MSKFFNFEIDNLTELVHNTPTETVEEHRLNNSSHSDEVKFYYR